MMIEYKLVPVVPTAEMQEAGQYALEAGCYASGIYADMLADSPVLQVEPVGWQFYQHGEWWYGDNRIKDHRKNTEEAGFRVRDIYAVPQPSPVISALVEALSALRGCIMETRGPDAHSALVLADAALDAYYKGEEV